MFIKELCQSITLALRSRSMYTLQTKGDQMNEMDLDAAIYFLFVSLNVKITERFPLINLGILKI